MEIIYYIYCVLLCDVVFDVKSRPLGGNVWRNNNDCVCFNDLDIISQCDT